MLHSIFDTGKRAGGLGVGVNLAVLPQKVSSKQKNCNHRFFLLEALTSFAWAYWALINVVCAKCSLGNNIFHNS